MRQTTVRHLSGVQLTPKAESAPTLDYQNLYCDFLNQRRKAVYMGQLWCHLRPLGQARAPCCL